MNYRRVIPRDLFNEAKLLKCLGKVALLIHDRYSKHLQLIHDDSEFAGFEIGQSRESGDLYCANLTLVSNGLEIPLFSHYNSREDWPLLCYDPETGDTLDVFDSNGNFSPEFLKNFGLPK